MPIQELLEKYEAVKVNYRKGDWLFREGEQARYYYHVISGEVKMSNFSEQGKEFVQGLFSAGQSFGEPPLFADLVYPASAIASASSQLYKLSKDKYLSLLLDHPTVLLDVAKTLAKRLHYKAVMVSEISSHDPEHRIVTLLQMMKSNMNTAKDEKYEIPLTRQQIADMTGLRVETVIRSIKKLEKDGKIEIVQRKVLI
ncbi:MAG: Crp/Fnr family transcriptional regulator [Reichenbachiella sp.]